MGMSSSAVTLAGGVAAALLVAAAICLLWFCKSKHRRNRNSETGSSDPSALEVEWNRAGGSGPAARLSGPRQFTMEELEQATKQFDDYNLIGYGSFGSVYKGLLRDGTVVAIKKRPGSPRTEFIAEVSHWLEIRHRNLVTLLGYCIESGYQMLVFEYLPNGSISNHLYYGLLSLLEKLEGAGPSSQTSATPFHDPEAEASGIFSEMSDVYSFGVFLLELVTGVRAPTADTLGPHGNLMQWVESRHKSNNLLDPQLLGTFTAEGISEFVRLTLLCIVLPGKRRPKMDMVMLELERIQEKEMTLTTLMGEGTATITPGSELFT